MKKQSNSSIAEQKAEPVMRAIDLSVYDRRPELDPAEKKALSKLLKPGGSFSMPRKLKTLARLSEPLKDVFKVTGLGLSSQVRTVNAVFPAMAKRRTSFWAWTSDEWVAISNKTDFRIGLLATAYFLADFRDFQQIGFFKKTVLARHIFGRQAVDQSIRTAVQEAVRVGHGKARTDHSWKTTLAELFLLNGSPHLDDLTTELISNYYANAKTESRRLDCWSLSYVLASLGHINEPIKNRKERRTPKEQSPALNGVPQKWGRFAIRWNDTSTLALSTRTTMYYCLLSVGRWLAVNLPRVTSPAQWDRALAAKAVAAIHQMKYGDYSFGVKMTAPEKVGSPLGVAAKAHYLNSLRTFFRDLQEWEWIPRRFDPRRSFAVPREILGRLRKEPRVIQDDIWFKLLHAGLNLRAEDFNNGPVSRRDGPFYPIEMMRALTVTWLFAGLRRNELTRLQAGCIKWQNSDTIVTGTERVIPPNTICFLVVPVSKTSGSFTKPVDPVVGQAIARWESERPRQPLKVDWKTGERVEYLFSYRGHQIGYGYINTSIIPVLCKKAGTPTSDTKGNITSHRARSTVATMLFTAENPMSLFELQEWLGHNSPNATRAYAQITLTKMVSSYAKAGIFNRALRTIDVLFDQDAVRAGAAAAGQPWIFYDLGHGFCTYDYFSQCPHRMACAKCDFYVPKGSSEAQILESKSNLIRLKQEISLTDDELSAVDEGVELMNKLIEKLANVPTPAGPTPHQMLKSSSDA
jgi:integrase